jgi:hypothetical protein
MNVVETIPHIDQQFVLQYDGKPLDQIPRSSTFVVDSRLGDSELWDEVMIRCPWIVPLRTASNPEGQQYQEHTIQRLTEKVQSEVMSIAIYFPDGSVDQRDVIREDLFSELKVLRDISTSTEYNMTRERKKLAQNAYEALSRQKIQQLGSPHLRQ